MDRKEREKKVVTTSVIGIVANLLLAALKAVVGIVTHSIAITMDAVNNVTDATSSIITIVGTKLAGKQPDKKHPFGHGRAEYLSALVIAVLVLYAGITALIESIKSIINPEEPDYTLVSIIIIAVAVVVKIVLGLYVRSVGNKVNSDSLVNSGTDALLDAIISTATVVAAIVYVAFGISVEAYLAGIISIVIIKSGFDMLRETVSQLLGERNDIELVNEIKKTVRSFDDVRGAYDLVLNNYGPESHNGSIHVEIPETYTADDIDKLIRDIQVEVYKKHNVVLTAVGVYSYNISDKEAVAVRQKVTEIASKNEYVRGVHGFYLDKENKSIRFDIVISFDAKDRYQEFVNVSEMIRDEFPDYQLNINMDMDFSEI